MLTDESHSSPMRRVMLFTLGWRAARWSPWCQAELCRHSAPSRPALPTERSPRVIMTSADRRGALKNEYQCGLLAAPLSIEPLNGGACADHVFCDWLMCLFCCIRQGLKGKLMSNEPVLREVSQLIAAFLLIYLTLLSKSTYSRGKVFNLYELSGL